MFVLLNNDTLKIKTSTTSPIDVYDYYRDQGPGVTVPVGVFKAAIISAGITTVIPAPGAGISRTLLSMTVRNRDVAAENVVTLIPDDGGVAIEPQEYRLMAGDMLICLANVTPGVRDWQGQVRQNAAITTAQPAVNALIPVVLPSDVVNNNAVANTLANVTGFEIPVFAGLVYVTNDGIEMIKKAPLLHKAKHDRNKVLTKFCRIMSERNYLGCCRLTFENSKRRVS